MSAAFETMASLPTMNDTVLPVYRSTQVSGEIPHAKRRRVSNETPVAAKSSTISPVQLSVTSSVQTTKPITKPQMMMPSFADSQKSLDSFVEFSQLSSRFTPDTNPKPTTSSLTMQQQQAIRKAEEIRKQQASKIALQEAVTRPCNFGTPSTSHFNFLIPALPFFADSL